MARATDLQALTRTDEVLRIRLDGAEFWDVREYVREKELEDGSAWRLADGASPLSDGQIRRYMQRADTLLVTAHERSRKKLRRRHLAQRRNLYAKAVQSGDYRTALAALQDEAKMEKLYPAERKELSGPGGGSIPLEAKVTHELLPSPAAVRAFIATVAAGEGAGALRPDDGAVGPLDTPRAPPQAAGVPPG